VKRTLICLIDKSHPPEHSFIDGMLAGALPSSHGCRTILLTSKADGGPATGRYLRAISLPVLLKRRGLSRFLNLPLAWLLVRRLSQREGRRGRRVTVLVRNEPVYLLAATLAKGRRYRLLFQQSYPHERAGHAWAKRTVARRLIRSCAARVDGLLAVSPLGLQRLRSYFGPAVPGLVVPLMAVPSEIAPRPTPPRETRGTLRFVYIGSHDPDRQLEVVIAGIQQAIRAGAEARFDFIGGSEQEVTRLREYPDTRDAEQTGRLAFHEKVPRSTLMSRLRDYDIGITLIPPTSLYREASPTKLGEYMGAGLAVLASRGVDVQEDAVRESEAGVLVDWSPQAIGEAILNLCECGPLVDDMNSAALTYATRTLNYATHSSALWDMM
jgi:glycosyltransferase involved in cell wall biosynthesis